MRANLCPARAMATTIQAPPCQNLVGKVELKTFNSVSEIPSSDWLGLVPDDLITMRGPFLSAIENACTDFMEFRYVLFYRDNQPVAFAYFQLFDFPLDKLSPYTDKENMPSRIKRIGHSIVDGIKTTFLGRSKRLLLCGNAYLTGNNGVFLGTGISESDITPWILMAARQIQQQEKRIFATLIKDFGQLEGENCFTDQKFHLFQAEPEMCLNMHEDWQDFDDYLAAMRPKYRQRARSAYKKSHKLVPMELGLEEMEAVKTEINELFEEVLKEDKFNLADIPPGYFCTMKKELGDQFIFTGYFLEGRLVAFKSSLLQENILSSHFIGYRSSLNREMKLYQRILYDYVDQALSLNKAQLCFGRTAMEIKSTLGAEPTDYPLYLKINRGLINRMIKPLVKSYVVEPWQPRHPFKTS